MDTELQLDLARMAEAAGVDFWGIADLSPAREAMAAQGGDLVAGFSRAISAGIALQHSVVDRLPRRLATGERAEERAIALTYRHECYDLVNQRLDLLASQVGSLLQRAGQRALPVPASQILDQERLIGLFSHKMAAHLAGLGWIGKSCLLVTPQVGPRARWVSILTDAPLEATGSAMEERCGACRACVDICPVGAFTGRAFRAAHPRALRYDAAKCHRYFDELRQAHGDPAVCGLCLYACPHGRPA